MCQDTQETYYDICVCLGDSFRVMIEELIRIGFKGDFFAGYCTMEMAL
jgi:hypothetical protein